MGLGFLVKAELTAAQPKQPQRLLKEIRAAACEGIEEPLFKRLWSFRSSEDFLGIQLHPSEEHIEFSCDENNTLRCSAKTSNAGPGYHAFAVDFIDGLASRCDFKWNWRNDQFS